VDSAEKATGFIDSNQPEKAISKKPAGGEEPSLPNGLATAAARTTLGTGMMGGVLV
jgi:hypothetical protein